GLAGTVHRATARARARLGAAPRGARVLRARRRRRAARAAGANGRRSAASRERDERPARLAGARRAGRPARAAAARGRRPIRARREILARLRDETARRNISSAEVRGWSNGAAERALLAAE